MIKMSRILKRRCSNRLTGWNFINTVKIWFYVILKEHQAILLRPGRHVNGSLAGHNYIHPAQGAPGILRPI